MKHERGSSPTPMLAPSWRTVLISQLAPEEWDVLYLHYIEGFDTAALAAALQLRVDVLEGPEGRLQQAERHLIEAYARCQHTETLLASCTPAELVRQLFPPPVVALPDDFSARVFAQAAQLRGGRAQRPAPGPRVPPGRSPAPQVLGPWHPLFAGERIAAAADASPQTQQFHVQDGDIQVTCGRRLDLGEEGGR